MSGILEMFKQGNAVKDDIQAVGMTFKGFINLISCLEIQLGEDEGRGGQVFVNQINWTLPTEIVGFLFTSSLKTEV